MHSPAPVPAARRVRAFTLIELLTVIAIIGILAAILIPTIGKVRASARQAQCASNQRQLAMACILYADANRGALVRQLYGGNPDGSTSYWMYQISPYISRPGADPDNTTTGKLTAVFQCPADQPRLDSFAAGVTGWGAVSYMNMAPIPLTSRENGTLITKMQQVSEPARHPVFIDAATTSSADYNTNAKFKTLVEGTRAWLHTNGANVAYYDGHVRYWDSPTWTKVRGVDP